MIAEGAIETLSSDSQSASIAGSAYGTPGYMAPEQAAGDVDAVDPRSDVFALGAMLCRVLTGAPAHRGDDALAQAARGDLSDAHERLGAAACDDELRQLALDCLSADPQQRPNNAQELVDRLRAYVDGVERRAESALVAAAASQARAEAERRSRLRQLALGSIAMLAIAAALFVLWDKSLETARGEQMLADVIRSAEEARDREDYETAFAAILRAEGHAKSIGGGAATRARVADLRTSIEQMRRDERLAKRIHRLRSMPPREVDSVKTELRAVLAELGVEFESPDKIPSPAHVRSALRQSRCRIDDKIARACEDTALRSRSRPADASALLAIADALDSDVTRSGVRALIAAIIPRGRRPRHESTITGDEAKTLSSLEETALASSTSSLLVGRCWQIGQRLDAATEFLERASKDHKHDLWIHTALARTAAEGGDEYRLAMYSLVAKSLHPREDWQPVPMRRGAPRRGSRRGGDRGGRGSRGPGRGPRDGPGRRGNDRMREANRRELELAETALDSGDFESFVAKLEAVLAERPGHRRVLQLARNGLGALPAEATKLRARLQAMLR